MYLKYYTTHDYYCIGKLILSDDKVIIEFENEEKVICLSKNRTKLLYNGIRKRGFHFGRDYPKSGIFELIINDKEKYNSIINNHEELELVKNILKIWYRKKYDIEEFTRNQEAYRLIELEIKFDWSRLNEIKKTGNS